MKSIFIDTTATREYVLPSEKSVVWTLGSLDSRLVMYIFSKVQSVDASEAEKTIALLTEFFRFGLKGLKEAETGEPISLLTFEEVDIPFIGKRQAVTDGFMRQVRSDFFLDVARQIKNDNVLTEEERKKSSGLSQSSGTLD